MLNSSFLKSALDFKDATDLRFCHDNIVYINMYHVHRKMLNKGNLWYFFLYEVKLFWSSDTWKAKKVLQNWMRRRFNAKTLFLSTDQKLNRSREGSVFKVSSRCFLRVMTHVENENRFSSTFYNLTDIGGGNWREPGCYWSEKKVKMLKKFDISKFLLPIPKFQICFSHVLLFEYLPLLTASSTSPDFLVQGFSAFLRRFVVLMPIFSYLLSTEKSFLLYFPCHIFLSDKIILFRAVLPFNQK